METNKNSIKEFSYKFDKPNLGRIFLARLFDLSLVSGPLILLIFFYPIINWKRLIINISISQVLIFFYFVLLPYFWKANTLGKLIFNLRCKKENGEKIKFKEVFLREFYFLYIPMIIQLIIQVIIGLIIFLSPKNEDLNSILKIINNISYLILSIWFIYIPLTIYLQKDHISAIDNKLKIKVVHRKKENSFKINNEKQPHVHLNENLPGKINLEEINKIIFEKENNNKGSK